MGRDQRRVVVLTHDPPQRWQCDAARHLTAQGVVVELERVANQAAVSRRLLRQVPALRPGTPDNVTTPSTAARSGPAGALVVVDLTGSPNPRRVEGSAEVWRISADPVAACTQAARRAASFVDLALVRTDAAAGALVSGRLPVFPDSVSTTVTSALEALSRWPALAHRRASLGGRRLYPALVPASGEDRGVLLAVPRRVARRVSRVLLSEVWNVGVVEGEPQDLLAGELPGRVRWLPPLPHGGSLADPFPVPGTTDLLAERISRHDGFGDLVRIDLRRGAADVLTQVEPAAGLESTEHRSFPFTFTWDGRTYCVPETCREGGVRLHRLADGRWQHERTLLPDVRVVDPVLLRHEERWWLLYGVVGPRQHDELHAAWSRRLDEPFVEHPLNPVLIDVTSARNAGPVFRHEGALHRVAQDCSRQYGGAVSVVRVTRLTPDDYRQERIATVHPVAPYGAGLHTVSACDGGLLVDGKRMVLDPSVVVRKLGRRLRTRRPP